MSATEILSWVSKIFAGKGQRLILVDRDAPNYPELKARVPGAMDYVKRIRMTVGASAYDLGEEFMYALAESGPILPFFIALLAVFASTFFPSKPKPKPRRDVKRNPADDDVMIEYDDEALASLKENSSEMVVMMFVDGKSTSQTVFSAYARRFGGNRFSPWHREHRAGSTVADFARSIGALPGSVIVGTRIARSLRISALETERTHPLVCSCNEIIPDGAVKWDEAAWPEQTNADSTD